MRRLSVALITLLVVASASVSPSATTTQNTNSSNTAAAQGNTNAKRAVKRGPVFRATKEQIKQAQAILKSRGYYAGEAGGKLDDDTRAGLKKYQEAESLKVTGTLNKATLEKMSIVLTDKQREWKPAT
ncbi:MAG TPA: peptidoglycan-binding domain-containing protein [Pyrinomonadaceae bacterium]|nr:peptidoglycan-binding domain-containing protein [Pyrinomonadaceae bacterium]